MTNIFSHHVSKFTLPVTVQAKANGDSYEKCRHSTLGLDTGSTLAIASRKRKRKYQVVDSALIEVNAHQRDINRRKLQRPITGTQTAGIKLAQLSLAITLGAATMANNASAAAVFINEFHYDNASSDISEGLEIAAPAGTDLNGWQLLLYNGGTRKVYKNTGLSGIFPDQHNGYGVLGFSISGIQNGPADGFALIDATGLVSDFISYEGSLLATDGAAVGLNSTDIGIAQLPETPLGISIQRFGEGSESDDFSWQLNAASFGLVNDEQGFKTLLPTTEVPIPASLYLFASACITVIGKKRLRRLKQPAEVYLGRLP